MSKLSWFNLLDNDTSYAEWRAINEAHDSIQHQAQMDAIQATQLQKLFALDRTQAEEIQQLRLTIQVLMQLLAEAGVLSPEAFDARIEQRRMALEQKRAEVARRGPMVNCMSCQQSVPSSRTQITGDGTVCDQCYYNAT